MDGHQPPLESLILVVEDIQAGNELRDVQTHSEKPEPRVRGKHVSKTLSLFVVNGNAKRKAGEKYCQQMTAEVQGFRMLVWHHSVRECAIHHQRFCGENKEGKEVEERMVAEGDDVIGFASDWIMNLMGLEATVVRLEPVKYGNNYRQVRNASGNGG